MLCAYMTNVAYKMFSVENVCSVTLNIYESQFMSRHHFAKVCLGIGTHAESLRYNR